MLFVVEVRMFSDNELTFFGFVCLTVSEHPLSRAENYGGLRKLVEPPLHHFALSRGSHIFQLVYKYM
jgi:hypothetical protein